MITSCEPDCSPGSGSDDRDDNFSAILPKTRTEIMTNQDTLWQDCLIRCTSIPAPILRLFKPEAHVRTPKMD
jgi:hypothetical protein